jgi:protoporphyrinogen oxidase
VSGTELVIVGAGPTGLGAAHRLAERGHDGWDVLEAASCVGGLARSITDDAGFTYDIGGHVLFTGDDRHRRVMDAVLGDDAMEITRQAWVWMYDRYLPYPFQHHLGALDADVVYECVSGLVAARAAGANPPGSFAAWIDATFGDGIARHFMRPYNEKVWATPLHRMSSGWIAERVAVPDVDRVLRNVLLAEEASDWGPNRTFRYPRRGGTGAIYERLAAPVRDRIAFADPVVAVDVERRRVTTASGRERRYDRLLSTAPLDRLVATCTDAPPEVRAAAARLHAIGTTVVGIGLDRPGDPSRNWIYYPEPEVPFHRVTYLSNYSPEMTAREDQTLLLIEVSDDGTSPPPRARAVADVLAGLEHVGLTTPDDRDRIVTVWHHHEPRSYPVPTRDRDRHLAAIEPWLARHGIASRGRFGSWRYELGNMDHAFLQGYEWVDAVLDGTSETVWTPTCA